MKKRHLRTSRVFEEQGAPERLAYASSSRQARANIGIQGGHRHACNTMLRKRPRDTAKLSIVQIPLDREGSEGWGPFQTSRDLQSWKTLQLDVGLLDQ